MANELQELRRSAVIYNAGPGAVVDFRAEGGAVSGVAAGLEEWDNSFSPRGLKHPQRVYEPRLQNKLGVKGFRTPPVELKPSWDTRSTRKALVAVRFPKWLLCTKCNIIKPESKWKPEPGKAYRYCPACTRKAPSEEKQFVVPVRFVVACESGHLDEFPWHWWVKHNHDCKFMEPNSTNRSQPLQLRSEGPGLAGMILSCPECKARRSMDGIFSKNFSIQSGRCNGHRPWLADADEECGKGLTVVQRGASNLYFPVIESALSIPPWSDKLQEVLGLWWNSLMTVSDDKKLEDYISFLAEADLKDTLENELKMSPSKLAQEIRVRRQQYQQLDPNDLRAEEHRQFVQHIDVGNNRKSDGSFEIRRESLSDVMSPWVSAVVRAVRLREVRAIKGFTRITPPGDPDGPDVSPLSKESLDWLPAIEVRGEGIFLSLNEREVQAWEDQDQVKSRTRLCLEKFRNTSQSGSLRNPVILEQLTPRYMLCHTLAHALMRQLVIECGYSSASLQERIYARSGEQPMCGLLLYTATTDSDGTLGGLERLGKAGRIEGIIKRSLVSIEWCSSDPLCISNSMGALDNFSLSVCHSCCLMPETSCEAYNRFLDRALLTGDGNNEGIGFFEKMIVGS